jgi:type VI secretion system protein VasG
MLEATQRRLALLQDEQRLLTREQTAGANHDTRLEEIQQALRNLIIIRDQLQQRWEDECAAVKPVRELERQLESYLPEQVEVIGLQKALELAKTQLHQLQGKDAMIPAWVDARIVAEVISNWTGIPVGKMLTNEIDTILHLKQHLQQHIIGQNHALTSIVRRIQTYRANLDDPKSRSAVWICPNTI